MLSNTVIKTLDGEDIPPDIRRYVDAIGLNAFLGLCDKFPGDIIRLPANMRMKIVKRYIERHLSHEDEDLAKHLDVSLGFVRAVKEALQKGSTYTDMIGPVDMAAIGYCGRLVCAYYRITEEEMMSRTRTQHVAWARHVAIYLVRKCCPKLSARVIAEIFARTDHTTILHSVKQVQNITYVEERARHEVNFLMEQMLAYRNAEPITNRPTSVNANTHYQSQAHPSTPAEC